MSVRAFAGLLVLATIAHLALAAFLPPAEDELYYWAWSRSLQWSYYDHPPMTALLARATTALLGDSRLGFRLGPCLLAVGLAVCVGQLTHRRWIVWLLFTPVFALAAVLLTPDAPLLFFWSAYALWLVAVHERLARGSVGWGWWWLGGVLLGAGVLSKYTMALAGGAGLIAFLGAGRWRSWLLGWLLHGIVGFAVASPILIYNVQNDFVPLLFQWTHATSTEPTWSLRGLGECAGVQMLFMGSLPILLLPWVLVNYRRWWADPRLRVCACLYALPLLFFLWKASRGRVEANWPLVCHLTFWPLALAWYDGLPTGWWRRWAVPLAFAPAVLTTAVLTTHVLAPLPLAPERDRLGRMAAQFTLAEQVADFVRQQGGGRVYALTYQWTAYLRYQHLDAQQVPTGTRPSQFTTPPARLADERGFWLFGDDYLPTEVAQHFAPPKLAGVFPIVVRQKAVGYYALLRYERRE